MPLHPPEKDRWLQVFDANESSEIAVRTLGGIHAQEVEAAFVVELPAARPSDTRKTESIS